MEPTNLTVFLNALKIIEWRSGKGRRMVEGKGKREGLGEGEKRRRRGGRGKGLKC